VKLAVNDLWQRLRRHGLREAIAVKRLATEGTRSVTSFGVRDAVEFGAFISSKRTRDRPLASRQGLHRYAPQAVHSDHSTKGRADIEQGSFADLFVCGIESSDERPRRLN
jgi:hypothetical protein